MNRHVTQHVVRFARPRSCAVLALALALWSPAAWSACTLNVVGVIFGSYDTLSGTAVDSTGNIGVTCDLATPYTIALSPGSGSYASRAMTSGATVLNYNLYTDATRLIVWGDGSGGSSPVVGLGANNNHTVYGRIPGSQNVPVGTYTDTITVTLTF